MKVADARIDAYLKRAREDEAALKYDNRCSIGMSIVLIALRREHRAKPS